MATALAEQATPLYLTQLYEKFDDELENWQCYKARFLEWLGFVQCPATQQAQLLRVQLKASVYAKLQDQAYPRQPRDLSFDELIATLDTIYDFEVS